MTPKPEEPFDRKQKLSPDSETYLLDKAVEQSRRKKRNLYNKRPELLIDDVQKIADDFPDIILKYGRSYFLAFVAGVLAERYGISIVTANRVLAIWNKK